MGFFGKLFGGKSNNSSSTAKDNYVVDIDKELARKREEYGLRDPNYKSSRD